MSLFISNAFADAASTSAQQSDSFFPLIMIGLTVAMFYFIVVRPQNKRAKTQQDMVSRLKKGDEVITTSGIYAKVTNISEQCVRLSIAENTEITVQTAAINTVLPKGTLKSLS